MMEFNNKDKNANPLYPPKTEKTEKELLSAIVTALVCLILAAVIIKNFNYYAIEERKLKRMEKNTQQVTEEYTEGDSEEPVYEEYEESYEESYEEYEESYVEEQATEEYVEEVKTSDYILEDSSERLISKEELWDLTQEELNYARNEIYARHGRRFKDETLQSYFDSQPWYEGIYAPEEFDHEWLSDVEKENAELILAYEKEMGYR